MATPHANHQPACNAANRVKGRTRLRTLLPQSGSLALTDFALTVLARTAADWFTPSQAHRLCVSVTSGRIRLTGHIEDARPMPALKAALLQLPGAAGLDQMIIVDPASHPAMRAPSMHPRRFLAG